MKDSRGFTLIELMVAMAVSSIVGMVLLSLYKTAALFQFQTLNEQPLQESSSYIYRRISQDIPGADCAQVVSPGQTLVLYSGRDCAQNTINDPDPGRYSVFCFSTGKSLLYTSGPWSDFLANGAKAAACDSSYPGWKSLSLPTVQANGSFSVPVGVPNQIGVAMTLQLDPAYADSEELAFSTTAQWQGSYQ